MCVRKINSTKIHFGKSFSLVPNSVVDTTGAGDSFTAGLIYKLISVDLDQINEKIAEDILSNSLK